MTGADGEWPRGRSRHGGVDEIPLPATVPGRLWLAGRRYVGPDPAAALDSVGASMVVCLCEPFELDERYPGYVEWLRAARGSPPAARWWPVPDLHAPPVDAAVGLLDELAARLGEGLGVLVHCGAGLGRAGTVAAALLMRFGLPLERARAVVSAARPGAGPEVGAQEELLRALADLWG